VIRRPAAAFPLTLEVIVTSVEDAIAAARGGAHRLEVVRELARDGLTPLIHLVRRIQRAVPLPLRIMVRESDGFACRSEEERRALVDAASVFNALRVDGLVVGWTRGAAVDEETLARLLQVAPALRVTFHHAFDALPDPEAALRVLRRYPQVDRVLTRGGTGGWPSRCATLTRYADWAGPGITILPGGGVNEDALRALAASGCVKEAHVGRAARMGAAVDSPVSADAVRMLRAAAGWS
jgi:copper homeostasis protein